MRKIRITVYDLTQIQNEWPNQKKVFWENTNKVWPKVCHQNKKCAVSNQKYSTQIKWPLF